MTEVVLATAEFAGPVAQTGDCLKCNRDILGFVPPEGWSEPELRADGFLYWNCPHCNVLIQEDAKQRTRLAPAA